MPLQQIFLELGIFTYQGAMRLKCCKYHSRHSIFGKKLSTESPQVTIKSLLDISFSHYNLQSGLSSHITTYILTQKENLTQFKTVGLYPKSCSAYTIWFKLPHNSKRISLSTFPKSQSQQLRVCLLLLNILIQKMSLLLADLPKSTL